MNASSSQPHVVIAAEAWRRDADHLAGEWQGARFGAAVSIIANHLEAGSIGAELHKHPYAEVFLIVRGTVTFTIGNDEVQGREGQIVVVPAGVGHAFRNAGPGPVDMIDIHESGSFDTTWLG